MAMRNDDELPPAFDSREAEERYQQRIEWLERHPANQPHADKTWVEELIRVTREHFELARRVR